MNSRLINYLKDPFKLSMVVTALFFAGILLSAYVMYILPNDMMGSQAIDVQNISLARGVLVKMYVVIGLTFATGIVALNISARARKEIIVYRDREKEAENGNDLMVNSEGELESRDAATFRNAIQQIKEEQDLLQEGLNLLADQVEAGQAALYVATTEDDRRFVEMRRGFAISTSESQTIRFEFGEGLVGQAAASGSSLYVDEIPQGYITILSGLGSSSPRYLFIVALKKQGEVVGVLELATFGPLTETTRKQIEEIGQVLAEKIETAEPVLVEKN